MDLYHYFVTYLEREEALEEEDNAEKEAMCFEMEDEEDSHEYFYNSDQADNFRAEAKEYRGTADACEKILKGISVNEIKSKKKALSLVRRNGYSVDNMIVGQKQDSFIIFYKGRREVALYSPREKIVLFRKKRKKKHAVSVLFIQSLEKERKENARLSNTHKANTLSLAV